MGLKSKMKGKLGELEASKLIKEYGFEARRGQQFQGGTDSPDVVHSIPGIHIEVKRTETLNIGAALEQADRDRKVHERPVILHRKNRGHWVVVMFAEDFLSMMREMKSGKA